MLKDKNIRRYATLFITLFTTLLSPAQKTNTPSSLYYEIINNEDGDDNSKIRAVEQLSKTHLKNKDSVQYGIDMTAFSYWLYKRQYFDEVIPISEKAVHFFRTHIPYNRKFHLYNLNLLGNSYSNTDDYTNSNRIYFEIIKVTDKKKGVGKVYKNIAQNYNAQGNFHAATTYFQKAIEEFKKEEKYRELFNVRIRMSQNYQQILNDINIEKGIENLKNLDSLKNKVDYEIYDEYLINETLGNLYNYENLFEPDVCLPYYNKALSIAKKLNNNRLISVIYNNIGNVYREIDNETALYYFREALKYPQKNDIDNARVLYNIGLTYLDQKKYDQAYNAFNSSLNKLKTELNYSKTLEELNIRLNDKNLCIGLLKNMAITLIKNYDSSETKDLLETALVHLKQADRLIDLIKLESTHNESKLYWREQASDLYINLVKVSYLLDVPKSAYYYLEKNKALLLLEDLTEERSKAFFNIPDSILKKEQELKRKIANIQNDLEVSKKEQDKSTSLFDIREEYELFIDSLQYTYPAYYKSKDNTDILSFEKVITEAKRKNTTFVHYILNDESGYGLIISKNKQMLYEIDSIAQVHHQISKFKKLISKPFYSKKDKKEFTRISRELYDKLLPKTILKNNNSNLVIVPDQNLQGFPFEALIKREGKYLIEEYDISYAYSISFLEQNKQLERSYDKEFLGFAPINYNNLSTLTNSGKEINTIAEKFDSNVLLKEKASEQNLITSLSDYKIIHLSTHANANDSITPWIATRTEKITLNDIYATKNNAELVTLSACNTSLGKLQKGEGVMSLARGFFNTGANSVVSTLWKADDQSTQEIVTDFYTYLKEGKSKSEALRQAKLRYLKNNSLSKISPYYWSSLILIGDSDPMYSSISIWHILIGILISSLFIFILYKRISKK